MELQGLGDGGGAIADSARPAAAGHQSRFERPLSLDYPRETTEAFLDGQVSAFAFLGGVPRDPLRQHDACGGADPGRRHASAHAGVHASAIDLFRDRFGRPGKGKVQALVETAQRRFMVPIPKVHDLSPGNAQRKRPPRDRDPQNPDQTWSGVGRSPKWVQAILDERGIDMAAFKSIPM